MDVPATANRATPATLLRKSPDEVLKNTGKREPDRDRYHARSADHEERVHVWVPWDVAAACSQVRQRYLLPTLKCIVGLP